MEAQFESLPLQQENNQYEIQENFPAPNCQSQKKTILGWFWENLQKIVSILVIIYLLMLILNIMVTKDPFFSVIFSNGRNDSTGGGNNQKSNYLEGIQSIITQNDRIIPPSLIRSTGQKDRIGQEQVSSSSTVDKESRQRIQQIKNKPEVLITPTKTTQAQLPNSINSAQPALNRNLQENYRVLLQQVQAQKDNRLTQHKYQSFNSIYSDNDISLHKTVHSLTQEEKQSIIQTYLEKKQHQSVYYADLLQENYQLNLTMSKSDRLHLELLNQEYDLAENDQIFMCVVLNTHNNAFNDQINLTLNSIFNQQYKSYEIIIADAASSDATISIVNDYLAKNGKDKEQARVVPFQTQSTAYNALNAAKQCREGSLVLFLDGNTELLGKQVFNLIDSEYRSSNPVVIYSNYYTLDVSSGSIAQFAAQKYDESERFMALYRNIPKKYGRIFAARYVTLQSIPTEYALANGKIFEFSGMDAVTASLLELSCGKIRAINQPLGLAIHDSSIQAEERPMRMHEEMIISMKKKFDLC